MRAICDDGRRCEFTAPCINWCKRSRPTSGSELFSIQKIALPDPLSPAQEQRVREIVREEIAKSKEPT